MRFLIGAKSDPAQGPVQQVPKACIPEQTHRVLHNLLHEPSGNLPEQSAGGMPLTPIFSDTEVSNSGANRRYGHTWAMIVCFHPDAALLLRLIEQIAGQVSQVWILSNGGLSAALQSQLLECRNLHLHAFEANVGIAAALNFGFSIALQHNVEFVATFDQDSFPASNHIDVLASTWKSLESRGLQKIGAVGPTFYDDRSAGVQYPFYRRDGLIIRKICQEAGVAATRVDFLITSGMLVPVAMWALGFKYRDDLFVDYVDTEWCFRANAAGFAHFGCFLVRMRHQVSDSVVFSVFGLRLFSYSPSRRYYYFRNTLFFLSCRYVPIAYKLRVALGLVVRLVFVPFVDKHPMDAVAYSFRGLIDGVLGKSGPL